MELVAPDLSARPYALTLERSMAAPPTTLYRAWTQHDHWFAAPGTLLMQPRVNAPYFFETHHQGARHPHYGRFLRLEPDALVEMTWVTAEGTEGVETVVTVELQARERGTLLRLSHAGFARESLCRRHRDAWPGVLARLDEVSRA
jgi:uncharacterized protein YndB with AHSA1/START domain